jgi:hypothetical protein
MTADSGNHSEREDRLRHIEELKEKLELIVGGPAPMVFSRSRSEEIKEKVVESVLAYEAAERRRERRVP